MGSWHHNAVEIKKVETTNKVNSRMVEKAAGMVERVVGMVELSGLLDGS